jgi:hypothetical protein
MTHITRLSRSLIAARRAHAGDVGEALRLFAELLADEERLLGRDHPTTLGAIPSMAKVAIENGDRAEACRWLHEGLERALQRFGRDHVITKGFQDLIASCGCDGPRSPGTPEPGRPRRRHRRGRGRFSRDGGPRGPR